MPVIVTHNGPFHADEVCAVALLRMWIKSTTEIVRTRDPVKIKEYHEMGHFIVDVGGEHDSIRKFDHHQKSMNDTYFPDSKIPMSSFGLVWKAFGEKILHEDMKAKDSKKMADDLYKLLVEGIDANDNGINLAGKGALHYRPLLPHGIIGMMNSIDDKEQDAAFEKAVSIFQSILEETIKSYVKKETVLGVLRDLFTGMVNANKDPVLFCDVDLLSLDTNHVLRDVKDENVKFIVFPKLDGQYKIWTRRTGNGFEIDTPLISEENAKLLVGDDLVFIHRNCFVGAAMTKEAALIIANASVNAAKKK